MVIKSDIDGGTPFDWGKTSPEYAVYRPGYPTSFDTVLQAVGIGRPGQDVLDLGTGTGVLARVFARQGAHVTGIDIADAPIVTTQHLAAQEHLDIRFMTCAAEETGLRVTSFYPDIRTKTYAPKDDDCFAFVPFCCQQQWTGGLPRVGFVFLCQVEDAEPVPQHEEVRDIRWMNVSELRKIFEETPEKIFTLQLGVLEYDLQ